MNMNSEYRSTSRYVAEDTSVVIDHASFYGQEPDNERPLSPEDRAVLMSALVALQRTIAIIS